MMVDLPTRFLCEAGKYGGRTDSRKPKDEPMGAENASCRQWHIVGKMVPDDSDRRGPIRRRGRVRGSGPIFHSLFPIPNHR